MASSVESLFESYTIAVKFDAEHMLAPKVLYILEF